MSVAAAIRISSRADAAVIESAASFAADVQTTCYVVSVVDELPYGGNAEEARDVVLENLTLIERVHACPVMQEGDDVAQTLVSVARGFGVTTLFIRRGVSRLLGRSLAERLLYLNPPFDVVVVGTDDTER
jgi:K+-sensing histidine kinase KdpD